jgi:urease accessory protein
MKRILPLLMILAPTAALAHPDHGFGLADGLLHPLTGPDHLLAMVSVGLLAAAQGGRARLALPMAFLWAMLPGAWFVPTLGGLIEPMILASVILLGAAVATALRVKLHLAVPMVALMGLAHGAAHGMEGSGTGFAFGMLAATAALHGLGLLLGLTLSWVALRLAGAGALLAGLALPLAV